MVQSSLGTRMIAALRNRTYSPKTEQAYVSAIAKFARHFGQSPEFLGASEIVEYQTWLRDQKHVSLSAFNQVVAALRFLYRHIEANDIRKKQEGAKRPRAPLPGTGGSIFAWNCLHET